MRKLFFLKATFIDQINGDTAMGKIWCQFFLQIG